MKDQDPGLQRAFAIMAEISSLTLVEVESRIKIAEAELGEDTQDVAGAETALKSSLGAWETGPKDSDARLTPEVEAYLKTIAKIPELQKETLLLLKARREFLLQNRVQ